MACAAGLGLYKRALAAFDAAERAKLIEFEFLYELRSCNYVISKFEHLDNVCSTLIVMWVGDYSVEGAPLTSRTWFKTCSTAV